MTTRISGVARRMTFAFILTCLLTGVGLLGAEGTARAGSADVSGVSGESRGSSVDPAATRAAAKQIDALVNQSLAAHHVQPNAPASDAEFLRRVYLDVAGRIPTLAESQRFLRSTDPNRRAKLIDELLASDAYVSNYYNYWADILRLQTRMTTKVPGQPYIDWVKAALRENMPYDKMVYSMLTAEGYIWDNGATGYYLRDSGMPLDNLSNTVRIFLGTQLGCAQCHDHPFDKWTQMDFYQMAAFTYDVQTRARPKFDYRQVRKLKETDPRAAARLFQLIRPTFYKVQEKPYVVLRLPDNYKYDDAKPKDRVTPQTIFGDTVKIQGNEPRTHAFADWLTSPKNPRFAEAIANRLWAKLMGLGLINPVDDIKDDSTNFNPELLSYLTKQMVADHFDLKQYLRVLLNTQAYQRQVTRTEYQPGQAYYFPGPMLRRMSAEQVWDSVLTLMVNDLDQRKGRDYSFQTRLASKLVDMNTDQILALAKDPQKLRDMLRGDGDTMMMMRKNFRRGGDAYVRASELTSPAPAGHFVREFGQSDREQVEAATDEPSITQALELLNGDVITRINRKDSVLMQDIDQSSGIQGEVDTMWQCILTRKPTASEMSLADHEIRDNGREGVQNLVWALINTREFLFIQ